LDAKKFCPACKTEKDLNDFHRNKTKKDGHQSTCKKCRRIYDTENKYKIKPKSKQERRIISARYYTKHKVEIKEKFDKKKEIPEELQKVRLIKKNYKYLRKINYKKTDITSVWLKDLYDKTEMCELCGTQMIDSFLNLSNSRHLDHIKPLCCGGTHTMDNVRYICKKCNLTRPKDGSDVEELIEEKILELA